MGYYINPQHTSKEQWLNDYGLEVIGDDVKWGRLPDMVLVCLVDNGPFTAAGICYDEVEFNEFRGPDPTPEEIAESKARAEARGINVFNLDSGDQRPRKWYVVPRSDIIDVCPEVVEKL